MDALSFRTRVAVLWVAAAIAMAGSMVFYLLIPGALEEILAGEIEGETLNDALGFVMSLFVVIPIVMAAVTLLINDRLNRYVNSSAGMAIGLFSVFVVVGETSGGDFNAHVLMAALAGALAFLIGGLGLIGLRQPPARGTERRSREEATV